MRKFFVTGGTGFIGREIVKRLENLGVCYILTRKKKEDTKSRVYIQGSISNTEFIKRILDEIRPTDLVHLAWDVKAEDFASSNVNGQWAKWSVALAQLFLKAGGKTIVAGGTCFEYDLSRENILTEESQCWPSTFYGMAKLFTCLKIEELCRIFDARFVWGRIFYPYGPMEENRKFISNVIRTFKAGDCFTCKTPQNEVDYVHVEDVAGMLYALVENTEAHGIYNVCTGNATRIGEILTILADMTEVSGQIVWEKQEKTSRIVGDNRKIKELGYQLKYNTFQDGIMTYFAR